MRDFVLVMYSVESEEDLHLTWQSLESLPPGIKTMYCEDMTGLLPVRLRNLHSVRILG